MGGAVIYFVVLEKHLAHTSLEPRPHTPVKKIITKRKMHNIPLNIKVNFCWIVTCCIDNYEIHHICDTHTTTYMCVVFQQGLGQVFCFVDASPSSK